MREDFIVTKYAETYLKKREKNMLFTFILIFILNSELEEIAISNLIFHFLFTNLSEFRTLT